MRYGLAQSLKIINTLSVLRVKRYSERQLQIGIQITNPAIVITVSLKLSCKDEANTSINSKIKIIKKKKKLPKIRK